MKSTLACAVAAALALVAVPRAQEPAGIRRAAFDQILDQYVRDGMVYYRALKVDRAKLDGYVNSLAAIDTSKMSREEQIVFWLNAYDAFVLRTVVDHYPMPKRSNDYPARSIRQIPGAFEKVPHRAGGKTVTLDQIETSILAEFHDPRLYFAIGRGSLGGGRLRSEAYVPGRLETQLTEVANECASRPQCIQIDREQGKVWISSIFSWREKDFVAAYAASAPRAFANRSPIERAALAFAEPKLLGTEREFLAKNQFRVSFTPYDWSLNDLTGRGGR